MLGALTDEGWQLMDKPRGWKSFEARALSRGGGGPGILKGQVPGEGVPPWRWEGGLDGPRLSADCCGFGFGKALGQGQPWPPGGPLSPALDAWVWALLEAHFPGGGQAPP